MNNKKLLSLPQLAGMLCYNKEFIAFLGEKNWPKKLFLYPTTAEWAAAYIRKFCEIDSRAYLATNSDAALKFKNLIEEFEGWKLGNQYPDNISRM